MEARMRQAATKFTDVVFPAPKNVRDIHQNKLISAGNEYITNLPLQMMLYFNSLYSPLWLITLIVMLVTKYDYMSTLYRIIIIAILVVMTIIELIRLYLGYVGNLTEKVPELAAFWLLTLLLQLPLIFFLLLNESTVILPLERAVNIIMTFFIVFEAIFGYIAIRHMVNYQVTKFHLQQFSNIDNVQEGYIYGEDAYYNENRYTM